MERKKVIEILKKILEMIEYEEYDNVKSYIELILNEEKDKKISKEEKYINKLVKELK